MVERCALSGSDLKIKFRTILLTSIIGEEWYILVLKEVPRDFSSCHLFSACLYFSLRVTFVITGLVRYRTASGSANFIGFGLRVEIGTGRTTILGIFDIIQTVRNIGIHLKVDEEQWVEDRTRK